MVRLSIDDINQLMEGLRVVELEGLAPSVFCGMYLADQGAEVVLVARSESAPVSMPIHKNIMNRNKKCVTIDLKDEKQFQQVQNLIRNADIVIDPYRPGVLEKLGLGPAHLHALNRRLILLRVSGYGQHGKNSLRPGHDLNYLSVSGILPLINWTGEHQFPSNYLADFVAASIGITGTLGALQQRQRTGEGAVVDCSLADGCTYLSQNLLSVEQSQKLPSRLVEKDGKEYIVTGTIEERKVNKIIAATANGYGEHIGEGEVSEVKLIGEFDKEIIRNPFKKNIKEQAIPYKGQHNYLIVENLKAKL